MNLASQKIGKMVLVMNIGGFSVMHNPLSFFNHFSLRKENYLGFKDFVAIFPTITLEVY